MNQPSSKFQKYYYPLIGAALAAASLFHFSLPVFSIGTTAGTELVNSATATYDDQNNNAYDVTSNEVTVTVGKIAGITNVPIDFKKIPNTTDPDIQESTAILPGDEVSFDFEITNIGNDATDIFIPEIGEIAAQNLTINKIEYITVDNAGNETGQIERGTASSLFANGIVEDVPQNSSIIIRVTATVSSTAVEGDEIFIQLGDTGTNTADVSSTDYPGTQNQADLGSTGDLQAKDVRTETADGAIVQVTGDPVNGQREASAKEVRTVGSESLALARLEKINAGVAAGDPDALDDNVISYNLNLEVAGNNDPQVAAYPDFPFNAADLEGRAYTTAAPNFAKDATTPGTFDGGIDTSNLILISDAIPEFTDLELGSVVAPAGGVWIPVYTESPLTTPADNAAWTTTAPATQVAADAITRVGWIYDAEANGALAAGSNTTGFTFDVITSGITGNTATAVYNMGQVFGSTDDGDAGAGGLITYDESGDQNPANLNDDGTFGPDETATTSIDDDNDPGTADIDVFGYADPGTDEDNVDTNGDNTATGSEAGEVNKVEINPVAVVSDIFNGPDGNADAVGDIFGAAPADDNHDFQNLAADSPGAGTSGALTPVAGVDGHDNSTFDPGSVTFDNTVENPGDSTINSILLEPVSPIAELGAGGDPLNGDPTSVGDLPNLTTITIVYDDGVNPAQTAIYEYDGAGTYTIDAVNSDGTGTDGAIVIPSIPRNSSVPYTVSVDLPTGTQLSTNFVDGDPANDLIGAYPAVIAAYINDVNPTTTGLTINDTYNVTVNQVYAGYLQLLKKARVLRDSGSGFVEVAGMGFDDPNGNKNPAPGDILEYQITYTNITEDGSSGTGNGLLQADDIVITEDGVPSATNDNNWANDNDDPAEDGDNLIDTLHPLSGANDTTTGSVITYFDENNMGNTDPGAFSAELIEIGVTDDIVKYQVSGIARLSPGDFGVFTFPRKITSPADIEDLEP